MIRLVPVLLAVIGLIGGASAGYLLGPKPDAETQDPDGSAELRLSQSEEESAELRPSQTEEVREGGAYLELGNQFVVPLVEGDRLTAIVVMSLSLEVGSRDIEAVRGAEPRLRHNLLKVLFNHANAGGFSGAFTQSDRMRDLGEALLEAAQSVVGPKVTDVLILGVAKQEA